MATVTLTFTDREDGPGFDVRGVFDPPLDVDDEPTDAQQAVLDIADVLARQASDLSVEGPDGETHKIL